MFLGVESGHLVWSQNFQDSEILLYRGLLIPQAWSLSLELCFYLLAPFLLLRKKVLIPILVLSIALRLALVGIGLGLQDPWSYRFFPTELALFLLGAVAHQYLSPWLKRRSEKFQRNLGAVLLTALGLVTIAFPHINASLEVKSLAAISLAILCLPTLFGLQAKHRWDRVMGEFSFPIYVWHLLVLQLVLVVAGSFKLSVSYGIVLFSITACVSIFLSFVSNRFLDRPVQRLRSKFRN